MGLRNDDSGGRRGGLRDRKVGRQATRRRHRLRRGAGMAVLAALVATWAPVMAPAARATDPINVPWSSVLPGWTTQHIASSENDCVSGRPACVRITLHELNRVLERTGRSCDHNAIFALSYLRMTQSYWWSREIPGYYEDVPFANHQDAVFAKYYTDAFTAWRRGAKDQVPPAWRVAFEAADNKEVTAMGDLLLGMNAHINRDLPFVLAGVGLVAPDGSSRKRDFDQVEDFLARATGPMLAESARRFDPSMDTMAEPTGLLYTLLFQMISLGREKAWRNAEALVTAPTQAARDRVEARIEADAHATALVLKGLTTATFLNPPAKRASYCSVNHAATAPREYPFGTPRPYGA